MKFERLDPPRRFRVGDVEIADVGRVVLEPDEQLTLVTDAGAEWDVARKEWGFYATPSLNGRLAAAGLRSALACGQDGKRYLLLVERGREVEFERYLVDQGLAVEQWLDGGG
jgi:hypothetical protein